MTPQEIDDHKRKWRKASYFQQHTHTDLRNDCVEWCKENCEKQEWDIKYYTDIYGDTIRFEFESHWNEFGEWYKTRWQVKQLWTIWKHALGSFDEEDGYDPKNENWVAGIRTILVLSNLLCVYVMLFY